MDPQTIAAIATWWQAQLDHAGSKQETLPAADLEYVRKHFACSAEEALRGTCVGEELYWGGE